MRATFRTARIEDAQRLSALMRETFIAANGHCSSPENVAAFLDAVYSTQRQRDEIVDGNVVTLIVEVDDGSWAGFAQLRFATVAPDSVTLARAAELGRMYLSPAYHGQGVAALTGDGARERHSLQWEVPQAQPLVGPDLHSTG